VLLGCLDEVVELRQIFYAESYVEVFEDFDEVVAVFFFVCSC